MLKLFWRMTLLFLPLHLSAASLSNFVPANAIIFDVGANIGDKAAYFLSMNASQVVCFEPHPQVVLSLKKRYQNEIRVVIEAIGLSDKPGIASFFPAASSTISSMSNDWKKGRFKNETWYSEIQVPVSTLDIMIQTYGVPDYCKIDVEGYELNVLRGLTQHIPLLSFEFAHEFLDKKTKPCLDYLVALGFTDFNVAFGEDPELVFNQWVDATFLFDYLRRNNDSLSWGDIYAR